MTGLLLALAAGAVLGGWVVLVYRRRELPIAGRGRMAALRVAAVVLVLVLLTDPTLPAAEGGGAAGRWVAVDASVSMGVAGPSGGTPWERALEAAGEAGRDVRVASFGDDTLPPAPTGPDSRLAPLLRRAAEAGARELTVYTDLRLADVPDVAALREALALDLRVVDVGEDLRSAGIAALDAPDAGRAGDDVEIGVEVFGTASAEGSPARLDLLRDGEVVAERDVRLPGPGRTVAVAVPIPLPERPGPVLWQARVRLDGDAFAGDDVRSAFTDVDPLEGILALVSLSPDWEPRFLLPVLARVTGLPARGWLRVGDDAFLPMDGSGGVLDAAAMARVADDARVLVVHGVGGDTPPGLAAAVSRGRRVLAFAHDPAGAALTGIEADAPRPGEWYAAAAEGALAGAFVGVSFAELPPLVSPLAVDSATAVAVELERAGGARTGAVALQERDGRRRAVVLARGFWRWAFRPGAAADAYDRLWSGVAGWLLALEDGAPGGGVGPDAPVSAADRPVPWWAPVVAGGRIEVTTTATSGAARTDTLAVGADGRATLPPRPAESYTWTARVVEPDSVAEAGRIWEGRLELESHTDEFRWPRDTTLLAAGPALDAPPGPGPGRPLRTTPWPWLLLLVLLSAEWILRRRSGLR